MQVRPEEVWDFGGRIAPVLIRNKAGSRKITLRVTHEGVVVSKPRWVSRRDASDFVRRSRRWVEAQLERQASLHRLVASDRILFKGTEVFIVHSSEDRVQFLEGQFLAPGTTIEARLDNVVKWMRGQARRVLNERVRHWSGEMGLTPTGVGVRNQASRWGSCSSKGSLSLNWRLVMAPPSVLDYIVIHELAHLDELNHSKRFWSLVARYCPEYKLCESWLDEHGDRLVLVGRRLSDLSAQQPALF